MVDSIDKKWASELAANLVLNRSNGYVKNVLAKPDPDPAINECVELLMVKRLRLFFSNSDNALLKAE